MTSRSNKRQKAEVVKLSAADWNRWDAEDALNEFKKLHPQFSDVVLVGRNREGGDLVIYTSAMAREYAHYLLSKAAHILLMGIDT